MTINLDTLRRTAEAATPGPWDLYSTQDYEVFCAADFTDSNYDPPAVTYGSDRSEDAEFIATFNPETVLALLSRLEQAEQQVARVREFSRTMLVPHGQGIVVAARVKEALDRVLEGDTRRLADDALGGGQHG